MLRCKELGFSLSELDQLEYGVIEDMMTEKRNDSEKWQELATQDDFDRF